jgi:hypothetical protein
VLSSFDRTVVAVDAPGTTRGGRLLVVYGRLLGPLLAGYLMFDKAFAYLHVPGAPLYIGEMLLGVGVVGVLAATGYLRIPLRDEPALALLTLFVLWGAVRSVSGVRAYGLDAVRDAALWYYGLFAFLAVATLARTPQLVERWLTRLRALGPWLLLWLPVAVLLTPVSDNAPSVPASTVSILTHKPGNAAVAALLVLWYVVLFPEQIRPRWRPVWCGAALLVIALAATQNRGGLLGAVAGSAVGLVFLRDRVRLITRAVVASVLGLLLAVLLTPALPFTGLQGRAFSATQLIENITSLDGTDAPTDSNLNGTVDGRTELWTRILAKQVDDGLLVEGSGFGPNLAAQVGVLDNGKESLRSPHNSHLNVLARMGLIGIGLWIALWMGWYATVIIGCRRLIRRGLHRRARVGVLTLTVVTAILVSSFFDPQLEGPQIAILLWTVFGVGVTVASSRRWFAGLPTAVDR